MRVPAFAMALCAASAPLLAQEAADLASYRAAVARDDLETASKIVDALVEARRPADAVLRSDPVLNAVVGRLFTQRGDAQAGRTYLMRATPSALPAELRIDTLFALAETQERMGDSDACIATLAKLDSENLGPDDQRRLVYAKARLALITDPSRASLLTQSALTAAARPQDRWEGEFILGATKALNGDLPAARAAADRAWSAAVHAPASAFAPARVALLRAAVAPDRDNRIAMYSVAGAAEHQIDSWLVNLLPICGGGLSPSDFVTFAVYKGWSGGPALLPVRASRPAVIAAFHAPFGNRTLFDAAPPSGGGTLVTMRCRSMVSAAYDVAPPAVSPVNDWMAERGLYPWMSPTVTLDTINAAAAKLDELEARYGKTSPRLLPAIANLGRNLAVRSITEGDVDAARIAQLQSRGREILRAAGAPEILLTTESEEAMRRAIASSDDEARALAGWRKLVAARIEGLPLIVAYSDALGWFRNDTGLPLAEKRRVINLLLARFADRPDDPRRRALLVTLAGVDSFEGNHRAAARSLIAAGARPDACALLMEPPKLDETPITSDDYPTDLIRGNLTGYVAFEVGVDVKGRSAAPRLLMSSPGDLFDELTLRKLKAFTFTPGTARGRPATCTGYTSAVRWKLDDDASEGEPVEPVLPDGAKT